MWRNPGEAGEKESLALRSKESRRDFVASEDSFAAYSASATSPDWVELEDWLTLLPPLLPSSSPLPLSLQFI